MKQIVKKVQSHYEWFEAWKLKENPTSWDDLKNPEKADLRNLLVSEQGHICCYCNQRIENDHNTHIEHFSPKDKNFYPEKMFDYQNLFAACNGGEKDPKPRETYCDNFKGNADPHISHKLISPLENDCETHFYCKQDGKLMGMTERGKYSIDFLNLNAKALEIKRQRVINDYIMNILTDEVAIDVEIELLLTPQNGKFESFCVHIANVLKAYFD